MNKTIYKYPLINATVQSVYMPKGAEILTVQMQNETPNLWALVDTDCELESRTIEIFGTGQDIPMVASQERKYIATFQMHRGALIFHAFELTIK